MNGKLTNINKNAGVLQIPARHLKLFRSLATGHSLKAAAQQCGYSTPHACRLTKTDAGKQVMEDLRGQIASALVDELPQLVKESLEVLRERLRCPIISYRVETAKWLIEHVSNPLIASIEINPSVEPISLLVENSRTID